MEGSAALMKREKGMKTENNFELEKERFRELFTAHYPEVVRRVMKIVGKQALAEDLAQEVFLQLYQADRSGIQNIQAWLAKASIYAAYNHFRFEKRYRERNKKEQAMNMEYLPSTEEKWLQKEDVYAVREALTLLDERERILLIMKYSGYNYKELAEAAEVESGSIGTLLARAKKKFRNVYKQLRGEV